MTRHSIIEFADDTTVLVPQCISVSSKVSRLVSRETRPVSAEDGRLVT